jgi:hypothetical protein
VYGNRPRFQGSQDVDEKSCDRLRLSVFLALRLRAKQPSRAACFRLDSKGVGLTETLLRFSHQEHLPIAIEYLDRASMNHPIDVSLKNKTIRQALDSILNGSGYNWTLRDGIVNITNTRASRRAQYQLSRIIPDFKIGEGETVAMTSVMLWWSLQIVLDPTLKNKGIVGDGLGRSSPVKPATLHNRTVQQILSYIVLNSRAEGWI